MADLVSTAVVVNRAYYAGGLQNKDYIRKNVTVILTGQGVITAGSRILASAFGLAYIDESSNFVKSDGTKIYTAVPSADGLYLLLDDPGTTPGTPTAITDTVTGSVTGPPSAIY